MTPRRSSSPWRSTFAVAAKELRESSRDRQTVIYTVVLPIAMYPVLFWMLIQGAMLVQGRREHMRVSVAISTPEELAPPAGLDRALRHPPAPSGDALARVALPKSELVELAPAPGFAGAEAARDWMLERASDALGSAAAERPDALLWIGAADGERPPSRLYYDSTDSRSSIARQRVEARVPAFAEELRHEAAAARGVASGALDPIAIESRNVAAEEDMGAYVLSFMLPMLLVIMAVMGAFFPAVDLTAGERERGTAETTLLLPVPRISVHHGKILAVACTSIVATSLNLLAMGLSAGHLVNMLAAGSRIRIELPVAAFLSVAPLALLFAFTVSAILTAVATLARTFKEGQALLGPVQLVFIFPAMAGALPGLELTPTTALVPVINVVLSFRVLLRGGVMPLEFAVTALSLLAFAVLASAFAVRVLSREEVQASDQKISLRRVAALLRSPAGSR